MKCGANAPRPSSRRIGGWGSTVGLLLLMGALAPGLAAATLRSQTLLAFVHYVRQIETRMKKDRQQPGKFLAVDSFPAAQRSQVLAEIKRGGIYVEDIHPRNAAGHSLRVPDGWIHDWYAIMEIPHATLAQTLQVLEDYPRYTRLFRPEIVRSQILKRTGNHFLVYARIQKKTPWVTVTEDMDSDVRYVHDGPRRAYMISHSTRVQQVEHAGQPNEHVDMPGQGSGYLWAMDSYWRLKQVKGGVVAEWESVGLSRNVPFALGWIIRPFVRSAIRSTVSGMMQRTRQAVEALGHSAQGQANPRRRAVSRIFPARSREPLCA